MTTEINGLRTIDFPQVTLNPVEDRTKYAAHHTIEAVYAAKLIDALDDAALMAALDPDRDEGRQIAERCGVEPHSKWITMTIAEALNKRGVLADEDVKLEKSRLEYAEAFAAVAPKFPHIFGRSAFGTVDADTP